MYMILTPMIQLCVQDIAILTSDESKCETYLAESENVKGRYFCFIDTAKASNSLKNKLKALVRPITKEDCEVNFE